MHRQLADIDERMRKGPLQAKIAQNNQATFETALQEATETSKANHMAANAKQLQLGEREAKVETMKGQLNTADSNKEFQLLKDRIAADEQANSVLADEILEMLEKQDILEQEVKTAKENVAKATSETERIINKVRDELKALKEERERVEGELKDSEKILPQDVQERYFRAAASKKEDALAETDGRTCGNCHQTVTAQILSQLMLNHAIFCGGCGALFYLKEGVKGR
jgi:predicted  nucleic acid-binding Zn-ribbon protein